MSPEKIEVLRTEMPSLKCPAEIVPLLVMPPANVIVFSTTIPLEPAEILP
jgi:hypothetical protein